MNTTAYRQMMGLPPPGGVSDIPQTAGNPKIRLPKPPTPNKCESEYGRILSAEFHGHDVRYEAITLRLPGGNYTPDWSVWNGSALVLLVECKGGHRHHSAGRSHMAFKAAIAAFPNLVFRFAQKSPNGWAWIDSNQQIPR
jgi:hypothetical protein